MAFIEKTIAAMSMPKALNRGNPVPLDASSIYYSYEAMAEYAANNAIAYVGQILSLVDEEKGDKVTAYIIADAAGTLKEVGSSAIGDQKSIVVAPDNTISLRGVAGLDFIKRGEDGEPVLDEEGKEQKINYQPLMTEAGLVWTIPSETTVEGLGAIVGTVQSQVTELVNEVGTAAKPDEGVEATGLFATVDNFINDTYTKDKVTFNESIQEVKDTYLPLAGGALTGALTLSDGFEAVSKNYVDNQIATEIGSAGHLKRVIVDTLPSIEEADADTIYMIKSGLALIGDKYQEYMLINGDFEMIGDTSVDLEPYAKKVEGAIANNLAALDANGALIDAGIAIVDVTNHIVDTDKHVTADERATWNEGAALAATNATAIENLVKISQNDADKLAALPAITEIGANLVLEDGILSAVAEQYELPAAKADVLGGVMVADVADSGLVLVDTGALAIGISETSNGLKKNADGLALELASADNAGAMSAAMFSKLNAIADGAEVNTIEGILLDGVAATIENKQAVIRTASASQAGLVYSTDADNGVAVAEDGTMSINRVNAMKLFLNDGEELVLNGGNA